MDIYIKVCFCMSDAERQFDHPNLRIRPSAGMKVLGTE
jgi:hypothetical protein